MLSAKQGGIKYHFLSLWYDSTWDWTPIIQTISEHSTHKANKQLAYSCLIVFGISIYWVPH